MPDYVIDWLEGMKHTDTGNPDVIADVFTALSIKVLSNQFKESGEDSNRGFMSRSLLKSMGKLMEDSLVKGKPVPSDAVVEWYEAGVGNEGELIANYLINK
ncbi:hypothetical protein [Weissella paramesenteroides]|uniref:Uncharacterized protein n=1 Tax=Weissella paramesenteroides ATCC 33313 TaxID=585506 RepID=C5R844_WEIPA|nr:hypothetical protein [Weissella paramesenteroides]EER75628.1 hypothetical protein HMPREF0877_0139 [Weissella paramesenteroides ATCC 33313]